MKKITIIYLVLMLALPVLLHAQYLGGNGRGDVMLESLNNPLTNTGNNNTTIPTSYSLSQNYPNPFNPTTNVQFSIIKVQFVTLKVFDLLGQEVATLVNEQLEPGTYNVDWNASQFTSGIYFYRLQTKGFTDTKKLILLK
jgi:hypothetical protein